MDPPVPQGHVAVEVRRVDGLLQGHPPVALIFCCDVVTGMIAPSAAGAAYSIANAAVEQAISRRIFLFIAASPRLDRPGRSGTNGKASLSGERRPCTRVSAYGEKHFAANARSRGQT